MYNLFSSVITFCCQHSQT